MVVDAVCVISFISIEPVTPPTLSTAAAVEGDAQYKHSASKTLGCAKRNATCSRLSIVRFANGPKRSARDVLGAKKLYYDLVHGDGRGAKADEATGRPRRMNPVNPCQTGLPGVA